MKTIWKFETYSSDWVVIKDCLTDQVTRSHLINMIFFCTENLFGFRWNKKLALIRKTKKLHTNCSNNSVSKTNQKKKEEKKTQKLAFWCKTDNFGGLICFVSSPDWIFFAELKFVCTIWKRKTFFYLSLHGQFSTSKFFLKIWWETKIFYFLELL